MSARSCERECTPSEKRRRHGERDDDRIAILSTRWVGPRSSGRLLGGAQHPSDGVDELGPHRRLGAELLPALRRQTVELRAAIVVGEPPLALDPVTLLQAVERRIE